MSVACVALPHTPQFPTGGRAYSFDGGGADRDRLLPVALAVGAFPDGPPDRVAVAAGADGGGDLPGLGELGLQPPGRGRAADDLLESLV